MTQFKKGDHVSYAGGELTVIEVLGDIVFAHVSGWSAIKAYLADDLTLGSTTGVAETVEEWPQVNDRCYSIEPTGNVAMRIWSDNPSLLLCREFGNLYRTRKDAEAAVERVRTALKPVSSFDSKPDMFVMVRRTDVELVLDELQNAHGYPETSETITRLREALKD